MNCEKPNRSGIQRRLLRPQLHALKKLVQIGRGAFSARMALYTVSHAALSSAASLTTSSGASTVVMSNVIASVTICCHEDRERTNRRAIADKFIAISFWLASAANAQCSR